MVELPSDYWTTAEVMKDIFETKVCLAKSHSPDACDGAIIRAHTIPKSQLQKIATDGHVYAMRFTATDLARNDGAITAKKAGVGTFSVLNSFCASHDNNVFKQVEDAPLIFDRHQLTLLHYRTICSELYRKVCSYYTLLHQIEEQEKQKLPKETMDILKAMALGQQLGIRDIGSAFMRSANDLFEQKYDQVSALVVHFKKLPSVMTVGAFIPLYDYNGQRSHYIEDFDQIKPFADTRRRMLENDTRGARREAQASLSDVRRHHIRPVGIRPARVHQRSVKRSILARPISRMITSFIMRNEGQGSAAPGRPSPSNMHA
jgi:hypothetical protein